MFQQLQDYLFQYKTVAIPGVGTFEVIDRPASLDVANQLLLPPSYAIQFSRQAAVPRHQLQALAAGFDNNAESAEAALSQFGTTLQQQLQQAPLAWQGVGALEWSGSQVQFVPTTVDGMLSAVPAQRVLRENVTHTVLVGEQEMRYTADEYEATLQQDKPRDWFLIIGWIIALVSILFLLYHFYLNNWAPHASGLRQKPAVSEMPVQYK
ncbi:hypothetical protein SAMN05444008_115123 [Cnuella takakiae]|uniref:Uncharacterized protein n=1 Tax=Cnuella takakiae TaxID=1302690 RepID=A0A1M5G6I8_9BACT|nr:hypothetical protein [Cnuella takakiae]OLY92348.1 hypothetical protein BUE76_10915 [Cnuella takakiae]SHF99329.1 hypothetical protein SAMN05444008_115123 [Cnuella takakiae]